MRAPLPARRALFGNGDGAARGRWPSRASSAFKSTPINVLHNDEVGAVVCAVIVDGDDIGSGNRRDCAGFALETRDKVAIAPIFRAQHFQRDDAVEHPVVCPVDVSRAAFPTSSRSS